MSLVPEWKKEEIFTAKDASERLGIMTKVEIKIGSIFGEYENFEALVNAVNCIGAMGSGVAQEFKLRYPDYFKEYKKWCDHGMIQIGLVRISKVSLFNPRYIFSFPTKYHWRDKSTIDIIKQGLRDLIVKIKLCDIKSIALPALGCGKGGLLWKDIEPVIKFAFENSDLNDVKVCVYKL